ncbi:PREDICTED: uncharacterized protein LOC106314519 [Brassica oleracea var. oleracea]|uniref:uncharacterized protein LOC106314519 n=1 Tax=Brassica oleracea var. oleracea TaxID=109376 RepID=UPI0006A7265D|nr:PREDICTED: uncharacterized protein LOC106314519 [Brassica oleracea var. oleracea]
MRSWGMIQGCMLWGEVDETRDHLFFTCPYSFTISHELANRIIGSHLDPDWKITLERMEELQGGTKYEKYEGSCEHCKRTGHKKSECWILHPHLRPRGSNRDREAKAHLSAEANGAGSSGANSGAKVGESEGRALASHQLIGKGMDQEVFKRADLEAFFKALKESGY